MFSKRRRRLQSFLIGGILIWSSVLVFIHFKTADSDENVLALPAHKQGWSFGLENTSKRDLISVVSMTNDDFPREPDPRPSLEDLVQEWNITGDVNWLLNFAIIGFPKCGTSTLKSYLGLSQEVHIFDTEMCHMGGKQEASLVREAYQQFAPGRHFVRGLKCPQDLESNHMALPAYETHFPKTRFLVGVRNPVKWFQSFYNFRVTTMKKMPPPLTLIGACTKGKMGCCTDRGRFHFFMAFLGKTNLTDPEELQHLPKNSINKIRPIRNRRKIFLYDVAQLSDENETRAQVFRQDLQSFLHLSEKLPPMIRQTPGEKEYAAYDNKTRAEVDRGKMNICDDEYVELRRVLLEHGYHASTWIRDYFVKNEDVTVSSLPYFEQILLSWQQDPCLNKDEGTQTNSIQDQTRQT